MLFGWLLPFSSSLASYIIPKNSLQHIHIVRLPLISSSLPVIISLLKHHPIIMAGPTKPKQNEKLKEIRKDLLKSGSYLKDKEWTNHSQLQTVLASPEAKNRSRFPSGGTILDKWHLTGGSSPYLKTMLLLRIRYREIDEGTRLEGKVGRIQQRYIKMIRSVMIYRYEPYKNITEISRKFTSTQN